MTSSSAAYSQEETETTQRRCAFCDKVVCILPRVRACCCACSLRTGVMVIAWVDLVLFTIGAARSMYRVVSMIREDENDPLFILEMMIFVWHTIRYSIMAFFNVFLIVGVINENPLFILITAFVYIFVGCLLGFLSSIIHLLLQLTVLDIPEFSLTLAMLELMAAVCVDLLLFYFTVVIRSYYETISEDIND